MPLDHHPTPPLPLDSRGHLLEKLLGGPLENKKNGLPVFASKSFLYITHFSLAVTTKQQILKNFVTAIFRINLSTQVISPTLDITSGVQIHE